MPTVSIKGKNKEFKVNEGETIFDALDNQGEELPHGCLSGSCGACRIEILEGSENLDEASPVEQNTVDAIKSNIERTQGKSAIENKVIRLSCRAKVKGDITFQILN